MYKRQGVRGADPAVQPGRVGALVPGQPLGQRPAEPVGGPVVVPELQMGAAYGFHRPAGRVRVVRRTSGVQGGPVAGQRLPGPPGAGVEVTEVQQRSGLLPGQVPALGHVQHHSVDAVQVPGRGLGAEVGDHGPHQLGHQPSGQGVQLPVGDRQTGRGEQGGPADEQPVGRRAGVGEAQ